MSTEHRVRFCCLDCGVKVSIKGSEPAQKWRKAHQQIHERARTPCRLQVVTDHA